MQIENEGNPTWERSQFNLGAKLAQSCLEQIVSACSQLSERNWLNLGTKGIQLGNEASLTPQTAVPLGLVLGKIRQLRSQLSVRN